METNGTLHLKIDPERLFSNVFWAMLFIEILLALSYIVFNRFNLLPYKEIRTLTNITSENSIANWFSSVQMLCVGGVLWLVTWFERVKKASLLRWGGWVIVAIFFTYMGFDDGVSLHEAIGRGLPRMMRDFFFPSPFWVWFQQQYSVFPSHSWQFVCGPFFVLMGLLLFVFLWKELQEASLRILMMAALSLFALAMVSDYLEIVNRDLCHYRFVAELFSISPKEMRHYYYLLEEFLEMFGTTLFLVLFLKKLLINVSRVDVDLSQTEKI